MTRFLTCALVTVNAIACADGRSDRPEFKPGRAVYHTSRLAVARFTEDAAVRRRILYMPFGEAAARIGSLQFTAESSFEFSRGAETLEQVDTYRVRQDVDGNFHARLRTSVSEGLCESAR